MIIKLATQVVWEAVVLPAVRFTIGYAPMITGVVVAKEVSIKYFIVAMTQYNIFAEWVGCYIPAILLTSLMFGVMASNVKKVHPIAMALMLITSLVIMKFGVSEMQVSFFYGDPPTLIDSLLASVSAVVSVYCVALMVQRAWADFLPKRKR